MTSANDTFDVLVFHKRSTGNKSLASIPCVTSWSTMRVEQYWAQR